MSLTIPFYNVPKPSKDELVLVKFTTDGESHVNGILCEYNCKLYLNHSDVLKRKGKISWNQIVPKDKEIVVRVDDPHHAEDIVQVSLAYIYKSIDEYQSKLEPFIKNKQLLTIVNKLSIDISKDINTLWKDIIYKIDELRREETCDEIDNFLLDYCFHNKDIVSSVINNDDIFSKFWESISKIYEEKPEKIISVFQIVSNTGITSTMELFKNTFKDITYNFTFKYISKSKYQLESSSIDSKKENHKEIFDFMGKYSKDIFIKEIKLD